MRASYDYIVPIRPGRYEMTTEHDRILLILKENNGDTIGSDSAAKGSGLNRRNQSNIDDDNIRENEPF